MVVSLFVSVEISCSSDASRNTGHHESDKNFLAVGVGLAWLFSYVYDHQRLLALELFLHRKVPRFQKRRKGDVSTS